MSFYVIKSGEASSTYNCSGFSRLLLGCDLYRKGDSLRVKVDNPLEYPFWYRLREADEVIEQGYVTRLDLARVGKWKNYYLQVEYFFGGQLRKLDKMLLTEESKIDILMGRSMSFRYSNKGALNIRVFLACWRVIRFIVSG